MKSTNWTRKKLMILIAHISISVLMRSVLFTSVSFTIDYFDPNMNRNEILKKKQYQIGAYIELIAVVAHAVSVGYLNIDNHIQKKRLLKTRLAELERIDREARERAREILSQIPKNCRSCKYCTPNIYLMCAVHPTDMQENCKDWEPHC